jgi:hypothetical protein
MMKKSVDLLEAPQRGLYRQPYILNSFRGHLLRVTQIQVVYQKNIIITASEDCSVRLWYFSGLYIGTLGQEVSFLNDTVVEVPVAQAAVAGDVGRVSASRTATESVARSLRSLHIKGGDDDFLHQDEDPNQVLIKPKVRWE